jgi:bifunctional enzyme CysN/CysC
VSGDAAGADAAQLSFVIVGHVDHGKSTVIGRLLADTGSLPEGKLDQVRALCARTSRPFEYAFLLDTLRDEQAQGITIDTTRIFFRTPRRRYMILDAPGHIEFLRNMVTGAAKADAALLVIDAKEGIRENSRRHGVLLSLLGIRQVAVLVNKMDLVGRSEAEFEAVRRDYGAFLARLGVVPSAFIPVSAFEGENLATRSARMPWYSGPTVLEAVEAFASAPTGEEGLFRMPVQDVYKFTEGGDNRRIVAGTVESGRLRRGDSLVFWPSGKRTRVSSFEAFGQEPPAAVAAGQAVGFQMTEQIYLRRGEVACREDEAPPLSGSRLLASVFWLGKEPLARGRRYGLKLGTARAEAELAEIRRVVSTHELAEAPEPRQEVRAHEVAELVLELDAPIAFETRDRHATLSRFVLMDGYEPSGGGVVRERLEDPRQELLERAAERERRWEPGLIGVHEREARNGHPAYVLLLSGERDAPRKEAAKLLERRLFDAGHHAYFLGFGNVRHGVGREEPIRAAGEVAQLFLDAGMILVISMQGLSHDDFQAIRVALGGKRALAAWMGAGDPGFEPDFRLGVDAEEAVKTLVQELALKGLLRPGLSR